MTNLAITYLPIDDLVAAARNARTHSPKQLRKLARAIKQFGFRVPILCDADNRIIAGHARLAAARSIAMRHVPVIRIDDLSPGQAEAFALFENRISDDASWSEATLAAIFHDLDGLDLDFELTDTGFEMGEIDYLLASYDVDGEVDDEPPLTPIARSQPAVAMVGDLFRIGPHRLVCGDARDPASYSALLGGEHAQMIITDVPFNVKIGGNVSGLGKVVHGEFPMASGEMSRDEYIAFLNTVMAQLAHHSIDGSIHFHFIDFRHITEMLAAAEGVYSEVKNLCVWVKQNAGMGSLYRSQHELVAVVCADPVIHDATGMTFAELREARRAEPQGEAA